MRNLELAVRGKRAEVVARGLGRAVKARAPAVGPKRCTMAMHSIPNPLRGQVQADRSGVLRKGENPSIGALKSPETRAKASDLTQE